MYKKQRNTNTATRALPQMVAHSQIRFTSDLEPKAQRGQEVTVHTFARVRKSDVRPRRKSCEDIRLVAPFATMQAHALYCRLPGQRVSLRFDRERLWFELFQAGFSEAELQKVVHYVQREIRQGRRNVGALKLSNLLQLDCFEEDLNISRVQLYAPKPPPPLAKSLPPPPNPQDDEAARQRALQILARFRVEHGF